MVEWKKLGEVCTKITDGSHNPPIGVDYSLNRMISSQNVYNGHIDFSSVRYLSDADFEKENKRTNAKKGDVVLTIVGTIGRCCVLDGNEGNIAFQRSVALLKPSNAIKSSFLMHYLINNNKHLNSQSNGGAQKGIYLKQLERILIPIPSLSEQNRIVGILDTFTASIDNLKEQIAQRRKQYEYYRDELLDLEGKEGVEMKTLGEIGEVCMCKRIMKEQTSEQGDVPFFKIGTFGGTPDAFISRELYDTYKTLYSSPKKGDILLSASGTIGRKVVYDGEDAYFQDSNIVWIDNGEKVVTNPFLYYVYSTIEWKVDGGTIKRLYNYNLKSTRIPVPPLQEQQRIVSILDTFEASIQNLEAQLKQRENERDD